MFDYDSWFNTNQYFSDNVAINKGHDLMMVNGSNSAGAQRTTGQVGQQNT